MAWSSSKFGLTGRRSIFWTLLNWPLQCSSTSASSGTQFKSELLHLILNPRHIKWRYSKYQPQELLKALTLLKSERNLLEEAKRRRISHLHLTGRNRLIWEHCWLPQRNCGSSNKCLLKSLHSLRAGQSRLLFSSHGFKWMVWVSWLLIYIYTFEERRLLES